MKAKLLLHTCCGPCFLGVWEGLKEDDISVTNFFYNPNIWPEAEYEKRKKNLKKVTRQKGTKFLEGEYQSADHAKAIAGRESDFPGRCEYCYRLRLSETARQAKEGGYDLFSTTLLVSPYQQHDELKKIGQEMAEKYDVVFYYQDFRPFYREGQNMAKDAEIYRQKYCGCLYSKDYK